MYVPLASGGLGAKGLGEESQVNLGSAGNNEPTAAVWLGKSFYPLTVVRM